MKDKMNKILNQSNIIILSIIALILVYSCSKDDGGGGDDNVVVVKTPTVNVNKTSIQFDDTMITKSSNSSTISVSSQNVNSEVNLATSGEFELSKDNLVYSKSLTLEANESKTLYVRFSPTTLGSQTGSINITNSQVSQKTVALSGEGIKLRHNYKTYNQEHLAFGSGLSQSSVKTFDLHDDVSNIESIKMYVDLDCPSAGCNAWDVFANILSKRTYIK